jgi:hypothetical protein
MALLLLSLWLVDGRAPTLPESTAVASKPSPEANLPEASGTSSNPPPATASMQIETVDATEQGGRDTIQLFKDLNRYDRGTQAITEQNRDLVDPGARHERKQPLSRNPLSPEVDWDILLTADRFFITGDEVAEISLELWHKDLPAAVNVRSMQAEIQGADGTVLKRQLAVSTAGQGAVARLQPDSFWPDLSGPVKVRVAFVNVDIETREAVLDFYFTGSHRVPANFTAVFADYVHAGSLIFDVGIEVKLAGTYRISANIHDSFGEPFGRAQLDTDLEPGARVASLRFDGLLFHDSEAQGPFYLTTLRGERLNPMSVAGSDQIPLIQGQYISQSYEPEQFRNVVARSLRTERMLKLYKEAVARGVEFAPPE